MRSQAKCSHMFYSCSIDLGRREIRIHSALAPVHKLLYWFHPSVRMGLDHDSRWWTGSGWGWDTFCSAGTEAGVNESKNLYPNHWLYKWGCHCGTLHKHAVSSNTSQDISEPRDYSWSMFLYCVTSWQCVSAVTFSKQPSSAVTSIVSFTVG